MFEVLNSRLSGIFGKLRNKGRLSPEDIDAVMREVRIALLEADVSLSVVKEFIASLKIAASGAEIVKSVSPANMVIKLVHDHLSELLGGEHQELNLNVVPPATIMMVGLQGSGKTTSTAKLAYRLRTKYNKKVLVASLDVYRPAAQMQLEVMAKAAEVDSLAIIEGENPLAITKRAMQEARLSGYDVLLIDTAGRLHIDDGLMQELRDVIACANPIETLLVADSLTGQDAVNIGREFNEKIGITGAILTRIDGDGRGGAALSLRHVTGRPIKFVGVGEKINEFEEFHPERIAGRILDKGDIVSLVERAAEVVNQAEAEDMAARMKAGKFDFNDLLSQLKQMKKMGGMSSMLGFIPGMGKFKDAIAGAGVDDSMFKRQEAIIFSMTKKERQFPKLLNGSRRLRIAQGAGVSVQEVNQLVKHHQQMEKMMKKMKGMDPKKMMRSGGMEQLIKSMGG